MTRRTAMTRRVRPRILPPRIRRLWHFHPEHITNGPADGVPITITARPEEVINF